MFTKSLFSLANISKMVYFPMGQTRQIIKRQKQAKLAQKIKQSLNPTFIKVDDVTVGSSSCGQMYNIIVQSELFSGKSLVQQHKMVTTCIQQQLKSIHGYNLKTKAPAVNNNVQGQIKK